MGGLKTCTGIRRIDRITKATKMSGSEVDQVPDCSVNMNWPSFMTASHVQPIARQNID